MNESADETEGRTVIDMSQQRASGGTLEAAVVLPGPRSQIQVRLPPSGVPGRAEAIRGKERWDAKHYWSIDLETVAYEFDGPLPAGEIRLRVPVTFPG
jgi:hypothetical protein